MNNTVIGGLLIASLNRIYSMKKSNKLVPPIYTILSTREKPVSDFSHPFFFFFFQVVVTH